MTPSEEIRLLKDRVKEYEQILQEALQEPKTHAVVEAGPVDQDGMDVYRVKSSAATMFVSYKHDLLFGKTKHKVLKPGTEIMMLKGLVVAVLPEKLMVVEEPPVFKLVSWDEIGGLRSQLSKIRDAVEVPLAHAELAEELGVKPVKGALLYGPPGCGKTLIAKAIASTVLNSKSVDTRAFVYVKGGELLNMFVGATEERIVNIFKSAREYTKKTGQRSVIFIDEAEAILPRRGSRLSSDVDRTIVPTFLAEMDGMHEGSPFVLLATNHPNQIDEAILREGRIDIKVEIARPNREDVEEIFKIHLKKVKCHDKVDKLSSIGAKAIFSSKPIADKVSGSMVETLVKFSAMKAMTRKIANKKCETGVIENDLHEAMGMLN